MTVAPPKPHRPPWPPPPAPSTPRPSRPPPLSTHRPPPRLTTRRYSPALEAACRYLAYELGSADIRVHAISPGPLKTRAASGIKDFELLLNEAVEKAPLHELVDIMDVGSTCAFLATDFARRVTGGTIYVDGGANIVA